MCVQAFDTKKVEIHPSVSYKVQILHYSCTICTLILAQTHVHGMLPALLSIETIWNIRTIELVYINVNQ